MGGLPARDRSVALETVLGLAVSLLVVGLQVRFVCHAGGLWRDEVASVNVAGLPTLGEVWAHGGDDSFPILWDTLLHGWIHFGPGDSDASVRVLGFLLGLAAVPVYWWSARCAGVAVPWVLLIVLGLHPTLIVYGSSVRGYGLGLIGELWLLGSLFNLVRRPTPAQGVRTLAAALVAVQAVFVNSLLLAAAALSWGIVCLWQRYWRALGLLTLVCAAAALSVVPYWFMFSGKRDWLDTVQGDFSLGYFWGKYISTLSAIGIPMAVVWPGLAVICFIACVRRVGNAKSIQDPGSSRLPGGTSAAGPAGQAGATAELLPGPAVALWCLCAMVLSQAAHFAYVKFLNVGASLWYDFPAIAFMAYCMEVAFNQMALPSVRGRQIRQSVALVLAACLFLLDWGQVDGRMTSLDRVATVVEAQADPRDLVVVWPPYVACVFDRYYHGPAGWISLPDLEDRRFEYHRLLRAKMAQANAIGNEVERIAGTLRSGHRVWFVGGFPLLPRGEDPAADPPPRWNHLAYTIAWARQVAFLVQNHCRGIEQREAVPPGERVYEHENLPRLLIAAGWKDATD